MTRSKTPTLRLDEDRWDNEYELQPHEKPRFLRKVKRLLACARVIIDGGRRHGKKTPSR